MPDESIYHYLFRPTTNLKLIFNIKTLIHTTSKCLYTQHQTFFIFTIKTKKKQAINLRQKYFHLYDTFYYNKSKKEQAINLRQKYFHSYDTFYYNQSKKEQAINLRQKYFHSYDNFYYNKSKRNKQSICARNIFIRMIPFTIIN